MNWLKFPESIPKINKTYLVYTAHGGVHSAQFVQTCNRLLWVFLDRKGLRFEDRDPPSCVTDYCDIEYPLVESALDRQIQIANMKSDLEKITKEFLENRAKRDD